MKKVVLLTGALAAGLASASLNANASVPAAPNVQEISASDQEVAEANYLAYHSKADQATTLLVDLKDEINAMTGVDAEAKAEILADLEKRQLAITGFTAALEEAWHAYEQSKDTPEFEAKLADLQKAIDDLDKAVANGTVYFPKDAQITVDLKERYNHVIEEWKNYREFVTKGNLLLGEFQDKMGDEYKEVDETADVVAARVAAEDAHELLRNTNKEYHGNRWYLEEPLNWDKVATAHATKPCCVDGKSKLEELYEDFNKKQQKFGELIESYADAKAGFETALENVNATETADLVDPAELTDSEGGQQWIQSAKDNVYASQAAAYNYIHTFNAANPGSWDVTKEGEDATLTKPAYDTKAQELINGVTKALEDLEAAIAEAAANDQAYETGKAAIKDSQDALDAVKADYYNTPKENVEGEFVYRALIDELQGKIDAESTGLENAWNVWDTTNAADPVNAVEYIAGENFNKVKGEIATALETIEENEAANLQNHALTTAVKEQRENMETVVAGYNHVNLADYAASGECEDGRAYKGTTALTTDYNAFVDAEQKAYDKIEAKKYYEETAQTVKGSLVDDIELLWNHIATDQCEKSLEIVDGYYNAAHEANETLDPVCDEMGEFGLTPHCRCLPEDTEANPCGWCDPTAKAEHDAIEAAYRENVDLLDEKHADTKAKELVGDFLAYEGSAKAATDQWVVDFAAADAKHKENLLAALHTSTDQAHSLEHAAETAEHHMNSFTEGDKAAADKWAAAQEIAGVTDFASYVNYLRENHDLQEKIQAAYDDHHYTELVKLGADAYETVQGADYAKAVEANNAARLELLAKLEAKGADFKVLLDELAAAEGTYYAADVEDCREAIQTLLGKEQEAIETSYNTANFDEDAHAEALAAIDEAISEARVALANAVKRYAANVVAAQALMAQVGEIEAAVLATDIETDLVYPDQVDHLTDLYDAALDAVAAERQAIEAALAAGTVGTDISIAPATALSNLQAAYAAAKAELAAQKEAKAKYEGELAAVAAQLAELELNEEALYADDYETLGTSYEELTVKYDNAVAALQTAFEAKNTESFGLTLNALQSAINTFKAAKVAAENLCAANVAAKAELERILGDFEAIVNGITLNEEALYADDAAALDAQLEAVKEAIDTVRGEINTAFDAKTAPEYKEQFDTTSLVADLGALQAAIVAKENHYAANVAAKAELEGLFANKSEQLNELVVTIGNLGDTVYSAAAAELYADILNVQSTNFADYVAGLDADFAAGTLDTKVESYKELLLDIQDALDAVKTKIADAVKFKAENVQKAAELTGLFENLRNLVTTAVVGDVYEFDANILEDKRTELLGKIAVEAGYVAEDLAEGNVVENYDQSKDAYEFLLDAVETFKANIAAAEKKLVDAKAKAAELNSLFGNLRDIVETTVVGDVYETDAELLEGERTTLLNRIATEVGYVAEDLANGEIVEHYDQSKEAYEILLADVEGFKGHIVDAEQLKKDNQAVHDALVNDLSNLLVVLEGVQKYGDVYPEDKAIIDYLLNNDDYTNEVPEGVKAAVLGLVERVNVELANIAQDFEDGGLTYESYENYKDAVEYLKADIEDLKQAIAEAETLYAENLDAYNKLDTHYAAIRTTLHELEANSKCADCDAEDNAKLAAAEVALNAIADQYTSHFNVEKDLKEATVYMAFEGDLNGVEVTVKDLKKNMEDHSDLVRTSKKAAENILDKILDFEFLLQEAQSIQGAEKFQTKGSYSNEDILYFDDIRQAITDLKAEVNYDNSHEGGHQAFAQYNAYLKQIQAITEQIKTLEEAIKTNNAAYETLLADYDEFKQKVFDAYTFWKNYYSDQTLLDQDYYVGLWAQEVDGELAESYYLNLIKNRLESYYNGGAADTVLDWIDDYLADQENNLNKYKNEIAHVEALAHYNTVRTQVSDVELTMRDQFGVYNYDEDSWTYDPFVADIMPAFLEEIEGQYGLYASLNTYLDDIEAAYAEGVLQDALNIDEHNTALGIHQQLNGVAGVLGMVAAEYAPLFEAAHHLTNGKTIYSDEEYFTLGFFKTANAGLGEQAKEMFNKVVVNDLDLINLLDLSAYDREAVYTDPSDFATFEGWNYTKDENDDLVRVNDGYATNVSVLEHGTKANELSFNIPQVMAPLAVTTLEAGPATVEFLPGAITVDGWLTTHNVTIDFQVAEPVVADNVEPEVLGNSSKMIVRANYPVDLTYTSKVLVATTDAGEQISFADAQFNTVAGQIEFALPAGTQSIELPEGFFTFRTGENTIARSAAMVVNVGANPTSIDEILAMGDKAQIFDLQGRRVKAESLISGNAYVVNGQKVMVK